MGRKFVLSRNKVYFCKKETITASSDYETGTFDYVIKSFSYITGACGYSFILRKRMFSINTEQVIS
ncbi:hypothetical protein E5981_13535 [Bacteroides faecichinchillae]|nr:hypothetical protein E5981_13535 [Bacteroides faecichinchillae]